MVSDLQRIKREMRACAALRRDRAAAQSPDAARAAGDRLLRALPARPGDRVAVYRAIRSELDPWPAVEAWHRNGIGLCLPVVVARDAPLEFRTWAPGEALEPGVFGVEIPVAGAACLPTHVVAPLLAWDRSGGRLGYGGGFYDRTLPALRDSGRLRLATGLAFAAQEVPHVPRGAQDVRLDAMVTETETLNWSGTCEF